MQKKNKQKKQFLLFDINHFDKYQVGAETLQNLFSGYRGNAMGVLTYLDQLASTMIH